MSDPAEAKILEMGVELDERVRQEYPKIAQAHRWEHQILRWAQGDPSLRTQILRFIDCLPALTSSREIVQHLREYFPQRENRLPLSEAAPGAPALRLPLPLKIGLKAAQPGLPTARWVAAATRHSVSAIARLFLAGANLQEALATIAQLERQGFQASVDLLGEATTSQAQADQAMERYLALIGQWNSALASKPHLSLKLSSLAFPFDPADPEGTWHQIQPRLGKILQAAWANEGFVNIDMEQFLYRDLVLSLTRRILEKEFPAESRIGVVIQAYLKDSQEVTQELINWVKSRETPITIRLVRGAYWDSEVILSRQRGWPCPVYTSKAETDASFERLSDTLLENHESVRVAIATHNLRSIARAIVKAKELNIPQTHWECQVLYGMGEAIQRAVRSLGIPVRIYCPVGELIPGMAYLVRRILENTSHTSFLANAALSK